MRTLEVRAADEGDIGDLRQLTLAFTPALAEEVGAEEFSQRVLQHLQCEDWHIVVAQAGEQTLGYLAAQDFGPGLRGSFSVGRLHDLFVLPEFRRTGAGRRLFESALEWARSRPHPFIMDWQASAEAVPFYESLGFTADWRGDYPEHPGFSLDTRPHGPPPPFTRGGGSMKPGSSRSC